MDTTTGAKLFALFLPEQKSRISREPNNDSVYCPPRQTDELLLKSVQEGDREAFRYLFRRYARMLHALGRRILRDAVEAEDLVQEVFLMFTESVASTTLRRVQHVLGFSR